VASIKENAVSSNASKTAREECLDAKGGGYALPIANALVVPPWAKDEYALPIANDQPFCAAGAASALIPRCFAPHELVENPADSARYQTKHRVD
jgi:hypothetical protein